MSGSRLTSLAVSWTYFAPNTLREASFRSKAQFKKRFQRMLKHDFYSPGELVIVRNSQVDKSLNKKTKPRYLGPFEIVRRTKGGSYVLQELDGTIVRQGMATFRLYPYITRNSPLLDKISPKDEAFYGSDSNLDEDEWEY
ncbi:hypothetical protein HWV62_21066 [Athelia sp. TMB]|nr:hypothetical protein HWV62_21066 [Athelia sp. TMB]